MKWSIGKELSWHLRRFSDVHLLGVNTEHCYEFKTGEFGYVSVIVMTDGKPVINEDRTDCLRKTFYGKVTVSKRKVSFYDYAEAAKHLYQRYVNRLFFWWHVKVLGGVK